MQRAHISVAWLEQARLERDWTQEYVAEKLDVDAITIRRWEHGRHKPQSRHYYQLCKLFQRELPGFQAEETGDVCIPARETRSAPQAEQEADACTRFQGTDLMLPLMRIVWTWPVRNVHARYHELQALLIREMQQKDNTMLEDSINRRHAFRRFALFPVEIFGLSQVVPTLTVLRAPEEFLALCAAGITACWSLRTGKDLAFAFDGVSRYIPTLKEIATNGKGKQRKDAAELLVQCLILKATLAKHVTSRADAIAYAQQAETYGKAAENTMLQILSLRTQAAAYFYDNQWEAALQTAEKAKALLDLALKPESKQVPIPFLVQSFIYAGLATYQSRNGQKEEAIDSLKKAHTTFFTQSKNEPVLVWNDHDQANLLLNDGRTHYHLGLHKEAVDSFQQVQELEMKSETVRVQALIHQALAEASRDDQEPDMHQCIEWWTQGIEDARMLGSSQRFHEATLAYATMSGVWRKEQAVKDLRDLIVWSGKQRKN
jgi:transcriptional regulator with XRE-family HTH domain